LPTDSRIEVASPLPETTGRYEIITNLGQGGMADVLLAVRRGPYESNKLVVIKKLKAAPEGDQELVNMFVDEARIAMRLSHPNVVSTFDFVAQGHEFYLTMEFLDGPSLLQVTRTVGRQKIPLELHVWILTQVLAGLGYAHQLRDFDGTALEIVHRDVTPSNVILTHGGGVKLVDFGIAKVAGAIAVTQSGMMKGKIGYASPEQCLGKPTTMSSDLYSVGVMLWEAMARKGRSVGETPAAVFQARIAGTERPIEEVWRDAPANLARSVTRALASTPEDRYGSAHEFQRDLEEYLGGVPAAAFGPRALAEFLTVHFGHARAALQRTIEGRLAGDLRGGPVRVATPIEAMGSSPGRLRTTSAPGFGADQSIPAVSASDPPARRTVLSLDRRALPVFAVVAVMGLATYVAIRGGTPRHGEVATSPGASSERPNGPGADPNASARSPSPRLPQPSQPNVVPLDPPGSRSQPSASGAASRVDVRVLVKPRVPLARVALDGERLAGYPYAIRRPRDGASHTLSVTADGYEEVEREVILDRDLRLTVMLDRKRPERPIARAVADAGAARTRLSVPAAGGRAPAPTTDPVEVEERPGMDLRRPATPASRTRHIDEKDPYSP
jgi:hypothetical protein